MDGAANQALIAFIADWLGLPKSKVVLVSGQQSRLKKLAIEGLEPGQLQARLPQQD